MFAAEFLIERLQEQVKLAPSLTQSPEPGGTVIDMIERLREGANAATYIPSLKAVEAGARRYARHFEAALGHVSQLPALFAQADAIRDAPYPDGRSREQALAKLKDTPRKLVEICEKAITELKSALAILDEGEHKQNRMALAK